MNSKAVQLLITLGLVTTLAACGGGEGGEGGEGAE